MSDDSHERHPFLHDLTPDVVFTGSVLRRPLSGQLGSLINNELGEGLLLQKSNHARGGHRVDPESVCKVAERSEQCLL